MRDYTLEFDPCMGVHRMLLGPWSEDTPGDMAGGDLSLVQPGKVGKKAEETWKEGDTAVQPLPSRRPKAGRRSPAVHIIQSEDGYSWPSPMDAGP